MALRGDLDHLSPGMRHLPNDPWKISRRPAKIVMGYHHARRRKSAPQLIRCNVLRGLNFHIAPAATSARRLRQDLDLSFPAALKQAASLPAPAGGDQNSAGGHAAQPAQEGRPLPRVAEIVETQFKSPGRLQAQTHLRLHFVRCSSSDHTANAIFTKRTVQAAPPLRT
jgi:hypothetical protein